MRATTAWRGGSRRERCRSYVARLLPWMPRLLILAAATYFGRGFRMGGLNRIESWYMGQLVLPAMGTVIFAATVLYALVRRHVNAGIVLTGCMSLVCLAAAIPKIVPVAYPASIRSATPSASVRLPADVPLHVVWGGDTLEVNQHVRTPDQRWAYDFVVAPYAAGSARLQDYGCYGVELVAPARGTIAVAHDGEPDMAPGRLSSNWNAPRGNYVSIRLDETGTYLIMAHLMPGSVRVAAREKVAEGQVIGQCGNSGNTSEPHIHIAHQRQDPALYPNGIGEGLPLYFRDQDGPAMPEGGVRFENGKMIATGPAVQHTGQ